MDLGPFFAGLSLFSLGTLFGVIIMSWMAMGKAPRRSEDE